MTFVVPLFLIAPLVVVPLGYRLLEVASPGSGPPGLVLRLVIPAAGILVVSFWLPQGPVAATLALPWVAVTGVTAMAAGLRFLGDPERLRPGIRHATDAAVAFLAVGAVFAFTDRLGARPFGFGSTVILLTAVHFHFAGFALPIAGAMAWTRRRTRWLERGIGAVVIGIPVTALGFFGFPIANWTGALLTAGGGFGIGVATVFVARRLATRPARLLGIVAGASLLVSMPLAIAYATGAFLGVGWLRLDVMAGVHGTLNALGFALPAMVAWTLDRQAIAVNAAPRRAAVSPVKRWSFGLLVGIVVGFGVLVGGTMVGLLGIVALLLLAWEPGREAPVGGLMTGFGGTWLVVFARADASCGVGCTGPDLTPWYIASAAMLLIGIVLTTRAVSHRRALVGAP